MRKIWLILLLFLQATLIAYGVDVSKAVGSIPVWRLTAENNLGSITHLVSPAGTKVAEASYDAWGRTRSVSNWDLYEYTDPQTLLYRGYAGYPTLQTLGLYHASARIYDPLTGRFLGYDPVVQDPFNSQNFNRYSSCLNNPLKYIDPNGKEMVLLTAMLVGSWISILVSYGSQVLGNYIAQANGADLSPKDIWFNNIDYIDIAVNAAFGAFSAGAFSEATATTSLGKKLIDIARSPGIDNLTIILSSAISAKYDYIPLNEKVTTKDGIDFWTNFIANFAISKVSASTDTIMDNLFGKSFCLNAECFYDMERTFLLPPLFDGAIKTASIEKQIYTTPDNTQPFSPNLKYPPLNFNERTDILDQDKSYLSHLFSTND